MSLNLDALTDRMLATSGGDYETSVRLMVKCLSLLDSTLPDVATNGLHIAQQFWLNDQWSKDDLEQARVKCWNYLDDQSASTNTGEPKYCGVRAVISVLYGEPPSDDTGELIDFFNEVLRGARKGDSDTEFLENVDAILEEFSKG